MIRGVAWVMATLAFGLLIAVSIEMNPVAPLALGLLGSLAVLGLALARRDTRFPLALVVFGLVTFLEAGLTLTQALTPRGWCGTGRMMALHTLAVFGLFALAIALIGVRFIMNRAFFPAFARSSAWLAVLLGVYVSARALAVSQRPSVERYWAHQEELGRLPLRVDEHMIQLTPHDTVGPFARLNSCQLEVDGVRSGEIFKDAADDSAGCAGAHATRVGDIVVVRTDGQQELPVRLRAPGPTSILVRDLAGQVAAPAPWTMLGSIGAAVAAATLVLAERKRRAFLSLGAPKEATVDALGLIHLPGLAPMPSPPGTHAAEGLITVWLASPQSATYRDAETATVLRAAEGSMAEVLAKQARYTCGIHISAILAATLTTGPLWAAHLQGIL